MEHPLDKRMQFNCGLCHMTNIAAMPIYGKALQKSSPEIKGQRPLALVCSIVDVDLLSVFTGASIL